MSLKSKMSTIWSLRARIRKTETWRIRKEGLALIGPCEVCGVDRRLLPPENIAEQTGCSRRAIYRAIETRGVFFIETPIDGRLYACPVDVENALNPKKEMLCKELPQR